MSIYVCSRPKYAKKFLKTNLSHFGPDGNVIYLTSEPYALQQA